MQYMMMFYETEAESAKRDSASEAPAYWGAWNAYIGALYQAGIVVKGDGLMPLPLPPRCVWSMENVWCRTVP